MDEHGEPHTGGFNATFINNYINYILSVLPNFHSIHSAPRSHPFAGQQYCGKVHANECTLPVMIEWHPRLQRRWRTGYSKCVIRDYQGEAGQATAVVTDWQSIDRHPRLPRRGRPGYSRCDRLAVNRQASETTEERQARLHHSRLPHIYIRMIIFPSYSIPIIPGFSVSSGIPELVQIVPVQHSHVHIM